MFQDMDASLRALLTDPTVPPALPGVDITFRTPDKTFTFATKSLNLFLSGVRENRILRDRVPIVELVGGSFRRRTPPVRVDCDYLVTAWSKEAGALAVQEEHLLLAQALAKLTRFPILATGYLQGTMVNQPFPVQIWTAQSRRVKQPRGILDCAGRAAPVGLPRDRDCRARPAGPSLRAPGSTDVIVDVDLLPSTPGETARRSAVRSGGSPTVRRSSAPPSRSTGTGPGRRHRRAVPVHPGRRGPARPRSHRDRARRQQRPSPCPAPHPMTTISISRPEAAARPRRSSDGHLPGPWGLR